jgi:hypothetical protein
MLNTEGTSSLAATFATAASGPSIEAFLQPRSSLDLSSKLEYYHFLCFGPILDTPCNWLHVLLLLFHLLIHSLRLERAISGGLQVFCNLAGTGGQLIHTSFSCSSRELGLPVSPVHLTDSVLL